MKNVLSLVLLICLLTSCGSGDSVEISNDKVVGDWQLISQEIDGIETISNCTRQTTFSFTSNGILRQRFFTEVNGNCSETSQVISNWSVTDNLEYIVEFSDGTVRNLNFFFTDNDNKFSISEVDTSGKSVLSVFERN